MGIRGDVSRNTLAHANQTRDWRIYADLAKGLMAQARELYAEEDFGVELKEAVYALDATTIDLCLSLFPWARFQPTKAAVKLHTILDLRGSIPAYIKVTDGRGVRAQHSGRPRPRARQPFTSWTEAILDFQRLYAICISP